MWLWESTRNSVAVFMRVTVLICTWNRADSLRKALESIEGSRAPEDLEWEVLIVDNNSTDTTATVCEVFQKKNANRYRYLFEERQGKSFALNAGIEHANGNILAFTDDDVVVDKDWLFASLFRFGSA